MIRIHITLVFSTLLLIGCSPLGKSTNSSAIPELELVSVYPVDSKFPMEPSGLTMVDGQLFTVADKSNDTIFRVEFNGEVARLIPAIRFTPPDRRTMDWEGISSDPGGSFYLISEERGRMLRVTRDGSAAWATPDLRKEGRALGMFSKSNAGFEGIAWLGPNHWLGAAEREARGLVEWKGFGDSLDIQAQLNANSPYLNALPLLRLPDFSGLHADQSKVYALFRNAHLVVQLEKQNGSWNEIAAWSYRHIETDPRWAYRSQTYGQAEGLVVNGTDVYLILDNNLGGKQADAADRRPILIHARIPDSD
jgi:uncharacterized protein YjiK